MAANTPATSLIHPNNGFCPRTKIFHSLRPSLSLPPETTPFSITHYVSSLVDSAASSSGAALLDAESRRCISSSELLRYVRNLSAALQSQIPLSKGDCAFILSPNSSFIPILYLSLLSLGVVVSPSNPANSVSDISRQIYLSRPVIAFATSDAAHKLPPLRYRVILVDSPTFESMAFIRRREFRCVEVYQSDTAAILYSSGTTGRIKGVELSHRNFISAIAGVHAVRPARSSPAVTLPTVPYFHIYGFCLCLREMALGNILVSMKKFSFPNMLKAIEEYKVTHLALAPPVAVTMVRNETELSRYDLSSLEAASSGGAPLPHAIIQRFNEIFPRVNLVQAYGLTETTGGITRTIGFEESRVLGSPGRLLSNCEAKIVDPDSGEALPPLKQGELWLRGPLLMKGYVNDQGASAATVDSEGWLRTGDLCYFDNEGFLYFVDRIKELIKYKGYQVAPAELEDLLHSHPDIVDAAVIPYPDEEAGQVPLAFVVKKPGSTIDEMQIVDFTSKQVAPYKKVRRVLFHDLIPKNSTGKVLRKELIRMAISASASKL